MCCRDCLLFLSLAMCVCVIYLSHSLLIGLTLAAANHFDAYNNLFSLRYRYWNCNWYYGFFHLWTHLWITFYFSSSLLFCFPLLICPKSDIDFLYSLKFGNYIRSIYILYSKCARGMTNNGKRNGGKLASLIAKESERWKWRTKKKQRNT